MSNISFGPRLKALRLQSKIPSATAFAEAVGISRAALYLWESSDDPPPAKHWDQITTVLGISKKHLLLGQDEVSSFAGNFDTLIGEQPANYGKDEAKAGSSVEHEARHFLEEAIKAAQGDQRRLGWILGQLQLHLTPPAFWRLYSGKPEDNPAVIEAKARAHLNAFRASPHEGKTGTGTGGGATAS